MAKPIKTIEIKNFRGATRTTCLKIDPQKKLVVVFGENGTGKTTIVDALDALANNSAGSLSDRSSTKAAEHIQSIGANAATVHVIITSADNTTKWTAKLKGGKINVTPELSRPRIHVLRRAGILALVNAEPAKRYDELARFIDVKGVEKSESQLLAASKAAETQHGNAAASLFSSNDQLDKLWVSEGKKGKSAIIWARAAIASPPKDVQAELDSLTKVAEALASANTAVGALAEANANLEKAKGALIAADTAVKKESAKANAADLVDVLVKAQKYLAPPSDAETCPVCENPIDIAELRKTLAARLEKHATLKNLLDDRARKQKQVELDSAATLKAGGTLAGAGAKLLTAVKASTAFKTLSNKQDWSAFDAVADSNVALDTRTGLARKLFELVFKNNDGISEQREAKQKQVGQFNAIKALVQQVDDNTAKAKSLEGLKARLKKAHEIVVTKRRSFAQKTLDAISAECNRLYARIHPGENVGNIKMTLDPEKRSSIAQSTDFEGFKDVPPQAYLSDSHLDTLGFCAWLAVAKRDDPGNVILVLDDILSSVDAGHLSRIVELLADECPNFLQTIVTTHFRAWRDRYRLGGAPVGNAQLLELHRWSLNKGVGIATTKLATEELAAAAKTDPLDRLAVASQAGILLEAMLDGLSLQYELKLPRRKSNEYTLGDLLGAATKLFGELELAKVTAKGAGTPASLKPQFDAVNRLTFIRNQVGAHFNLTGMDVSNPDVEDFGKATLELAAAIMCADCGQVPDRRDGTHFRCSCKKAQMTPLEWKK